MIVTITEPVKLEIMTKLHEMAERDLASAYPDFKLESDENAGELLTRLGMWPHPELYDQIPHQWLMPLSESMCNVWLVSQRYKGAKSERVVGRSSGQLKTWFWNWQYGSDRWLERKAKSTNAQFFHAYVHFPKTTHGFQRPYRNMFDGDNPRPEITQDILNQLATRYPSMIGLSTIQRNFSLLPEILELQKKWRLIEDQISKVLVTYKTINQAVKDVPALKLYLDDKHLQKLNKKQESKKKTNLIEASVLEIDHDLLSSAAVADLLTKGNSNAED